MCIDIMYLTDTYTSIDYDVTKLSAWTILCDVPASNNLELPESWTPVKEHRDYRQLQSTVPEYQYLTVLYTAWEKNTSLRLSRDKS